MDSKELRIEQMAQTFAIQYVNASVDLTNPDTVKRIASGAVALASAIVSYSETAAREETQAPE